MANYNELPVFKAVYDLLLRTFQVSQHWRRDLRYTLGEQLKKEITDILQLIYQANSSHKKLAYISSCRRKMVKVKIQIRVVKDMKEMKISQYASLAELTENISKQLAGWERVERKREKSLIEDKNN